VTRCTPTRKCDFHRDGGPSSARCPGVWDANGCSLDGFYEVSHEKSMCAAHAAIVLLARAVHEALGDDNKEGR
ncbi:MAG TPA: hypothetical protein VFM23_07940, partial [Gemmatimonadales bacterium]|nr:hypothetical protein [Gemmatimonadales bacterium]